MYIYPVKSLSGISVSEAVAERRGFRYDRRWMLITPTGDFVTQREFPEMVLIGTAIEPPYLVVFLRQAPENRILIPLDPPVHDMPKIRVSVWSDRCSARVHEDSINAWFSTVLGSDLRLVYMPDTTRRRADGRYAPSGQFVSFADGFPYLLVGQSSLDALNERLTEPVPMNRFRPNIVFEGGRPFEEDQWAEFQAGNVLLKGVKPCGRCIMTTINQDNASKQAEPLKTLTSFRKSGNKVLFGQNVVLLDAERPAKVIRVGDAITR